MLIFLAGYWLVILILFSYFLLTSDIADSANCTSETYHCKHSPKCITQDDVCNGVSNCLKGDDEGKNCGEWRIEQNFYLNKVKLQMGVPAEDTRMKI